MLSIRKRTARRLVVSGVCLLRGEVYLPHGIVGSKTPHPCEQTDACENITFPQLRLRAEIIIIAVVLLSLKLCQ